MLIYIMLLIIINITLITDNSTTKTLGIMKKRSVSVLVSNIAEI